MKNRKWIMAILLPCALLLLNNSFAQEKINWGKLQTSTKKSYYPNILGEDDDNIYIYADVGNAGMIESFKKGDFTRKLSKEITPQKIDGNKCQIEEVTFVDGKFYVFISYYDKKAKVSNIYVYNMDGKTGAKVGKEKKLFEVEVEKKRRRGNFNVTVSKDKTKMLVNHIAYYRTQKKWKDKYRLLDKDLTILLEKEESIGRGDVRYASTHHKIDEDGSIFFLKKYFSTTGNDNLYIVSFDANRDYEKWEEEISMTDLDVKSSTSVVKDLTYTINDKDELVLCGYYSENLQQGVKKNGKEKRPIMEFVGSFYMSIDKKSKETKNVKINRFDKSFNDQFRNRKEVEKDKDVKIPDSFHDIQLIPKADGGMIMIGELYVYIHRDTDDGGTYHYELFGDLIVLNMDATGHLLWANRVPKKQVFWWQRTPRGMIIASTGVSALVPPNWRITQYFSYQASLLDDELVILFNDNPKNTLSTNDETRMKPLKKINNATVTSFSMNLQSGIKKEKLFMGGKDFEVHYKPMVKYQHDQNSATYTFGMKKKKFKYGTLE